MELEKQTLRKWYRLTFLSNKPHQMLMEEEIHQSLEDLLGPMQMIPKQIPEQKQTMDLNL